MDEIKKLSFWEIQTIVEDLLCGKDQQVHMKILMRLVLACIKAILCMHQSDRPDVVSHAEIVLYKAVAEVKEGIREHKL